MFDQIDINNCYQYSITLCGVTYTVPMYLITGKGSDYFTMNQPNDPSNSECIDAITWGLYFLYIPDFVTPNLNQVPLLNTEFGITGRGWRWGFLLTINPNSISTLKEISLR